MSCEAVYPALAETFSNVLSPTEVLEPYRNSRSKWANAVQWAVMHLRSGGTLLPVERSGRGVWALSDRNFPPPRRQLSGRGCATPRDPRQRGWGL